MKTDSSYKDVSSLKKSIRSAVQGERDKLEEGSRLEKSLVISRKFIGLKLYRDSGSILAYYPFRSEIDTRIIIKDALDSCKGIILPRVGAGGLELFYVKDLAEDLETGSYDIMEPIPSKCRAADPREIDIAIVPGVAFDRSLNRLGYGGGFYDRLLSHVPQEVPRIALAFDLQIISSVPVSEHDLKVDMLITESFIC